MVSYKSLSTYQIKNKGIVYIVNNDKDRNREDLKELIGVEVIIDEQVFKIKGVESNAIPFISKNQKLGFLV